MIFVCWEYPLEVEKFYIRNELLLMLSKDFYFWDEIFMLLKLHIIKPLIQKNKMELWLKIVNALIKIKCVFSTMHYLMDRKLGWSRGYENWLLILFMKTTFIYLNFFFKKKKKTNIEFTKRVINFVQSFRRWNDWGNNNIYL